MEEIKGYDNGALFDEQAYKHEKEQPDSFTVSGQVITDYNDETLDPYDDVFEFAGYYFAASDVDEFIQFLLEKHIFGAKELFNEMNVKGQSQFLVNGFTDTSNDFTEMFDFDEVEMS